MELPTLDHPGWGRLLAVVAAEQGPRPVQRTLELVRDEDTTAEHDRVEDVEPATSDMYA